MDVAITRMSSKGQVVIPAEMRGNIAEGEKLLIIQSGDDLLLKKASKSAINFKDDLAFAKKTEEAWKQYDRGEFKAMEFDDFLKEVKKW